ncbi:MAG: hypothetical protein JO301_14985 [Chitinophagaceae bacterium]|nr:hypothetical protein [Chitinophagaceae bacterium]
MTGCNKFVDPVDNIVDTTRPQVLLPSGTVKEFIALDSLIGYLHGSALRWNVTGTNSKTVVRLDSVIVGNYGSLQTGQLRQTTTFLLTVNSGKSATAKVYVADSLSTMLWNEGRRWKLVDALSYEYKSVNGQLVQDFYSHFTDKLANERTSFNLDGTSSEVQITANYPQPKPGGKYTTVTNPMIPTYAELRWKGHRYLIDTLTDMKLTMTFDSTLSTGFNVTNRVRYKLEY